PTTSGLILRRKRLTWKELNERAKAFANSLFELGLERGDRVAIYAKNSNQWVEALFGLAQVGLVSVTVNYRLTANEVSFIVENSGAKAIICDESTEQNSIEVKEKVAELKQIITPQIFENLIENRQSQIANCKSQIEGDEPAMLLYTSGTTGFPKGAVYSHYSLLVGMLVHVHAIASRQTHRVMLPSPLYSAAGIAGIYCAVYVGSQISLINYDVETACVTIERDKITFTNLVPTTIQMLLASEVSKKYDLSSLEVLLYGGSPIPEPVLREAMHRFPKCGFRQTFATTETGCAGTVLEPSEHRLALENVEKKHLLQSCGRPQTNVDVRIVDEEWNELPTNEVGEIAIRTEANMVGYWNNLDATAKTLRDGWLRTGDMARMEADGYLYLVDRKNDMIVSGALNVYPSEVERILQKHPSIFEVAVIGVESEKWGEEVKAVVVLKEGENVSESEIIQFCEGKLAGFKKPKTVEFIDKLPRNLTGKILKKDLRERFN
ncbi:MAG: long-chain fatty acid--CoA ligase, partial [Blastocatellia bacterium]|nr:long-chain fatty acid--CoA ligase [Blastocatellia bacterium]